MKTDGTRLQSLKLSQTRGKVARLVEWITGLYKQRTNRISDKIDIKTNASSFFKSKRKLEDNYLSCSDVETHMKKTSTGTLQQYSSEDNAIPYEAKIQSKLKSRNYGMRKDPNGNVLPPNFIRQKKWSSSSQQDLFGTENKEERFLLKSPIRLPRNAFNQLNHLRRHNRLSLNFHDQQEIVLKTSSSLEWVQEPAQQLVFSNNTGGLLNCQARGVAGQAKVVWSYVNGMPVTPVSINSEYLISW